jgi:histidyl-tRNA synthetase
VCEQFGYEEYLTPILEDADIYRAKSGEDVGGKELMTMEDRAGRELSIRPEMTPSVTRMVSRIYDAEPKPIRYFSIANYVRNEKPQRGRNREFWQLNYDIFGSDEINADIEIVQMALEIMLEFNPPEDSFVVYINNRKLIDAVLKKYADVSDELRVQVVRTLDKWEKLSEDDFVERIVSLGLDREQTQGLVKFMQSKTSEELVDNLSWLAENEGYLETLKIIESLQNLGYSDWISFQPNIIRGFDYYDGMVFEVFDNHPDNQRSLFGGGRYNGLASLFGKDSFPGVGCAPGDETTKLFLEAWELLGELDLKSEVYYLPIIDKNLEDDSQELARKLRQEGKNVQIGLEEERIGNALSYADSKEIPFVILFGEDEKSKGIYQLKDMNSGEQTEIKL